jgi:hypothetical protein
MGPTTFNGLPAHPLLVHAVVVLVPLTALLVLLSISWPAARSRLGVVTPVFAFVTLALVPITTHAGEWLEHGRKRISPLLQRHAELGDQLIYWSAGVFVAALVWWLSYDHRIATWIATRNTRANSIVTGTPARLVVALLAAISAVGSLIMVYRIGDTGAQSVWGKGS